MGTRAWPTAANFTDWLGDTVSTAGLALAADLVAEATEFMVERIGPAARNYYGIRPDDAAAGCTQPLYRAIILFAALELSRRASHAGIELGDGFALRVAGGDALAERLVTNYVNWRAA